MRFRVTFEVDWSELPALIEHTGEFDAPDVDVIKDGKPKRERSRTPPSETDAGKAVLAQVAGSGAREWKAPDFFARFEGLGYAKSSVTPVLSQLVAEGHLVRVGKGAYRAAAA